ncbi:MAG: hypothetical protein LCH58_08900 [Bacteroidetes bacterium]|uniref:hypothetical protein n=1 Tax=Phnomibacter sp. TaxID=2836217 RepID=UPI002FDE2203|nr:hypothetical protein [Bacteroidota bacterium]
MLLLTLSVWNTLGIIAVIALVISFFKAKNAVWGTATLGLVVALIIGIIGWLKNSKFNWEGFKQVMIIAILVGVIFELLSMVSKRKKSID